MKAYGREDHVRLAAWAADCAERVLPFFTSALPNDDRPLFAIATGREWALSGFFALRTIRGASLGAHAAAKLVPAGSPAALAAHAAGQAVATAHVPQHAFGAAYYALRAIAAADPPASLASVAGEYEWQVECVADGLRNEVRRRVVIGRRGNRATVTIDKSGDF
jgi:hypothetical protein